MGGQLDEHLLFWQPTVSIIIYFGMQIKYDDDDDDGSLVDTYTVSHKKVPNFKLSVTLSSLNRFSNFCTTEKRVEFTGKRMQYYPYHLNNACCYTTAGNYKFKLCADIQQMWENQINIIFIPVTLLFIHKYRHYRR